MSEISLHVNGFPPAKNEAKSMLAAGHVHADRVLLLLQVARDEAARADWQVQKAASLGLELVLRSPKPPPSDATNYLGGVGDVLEDKTHRGCLSHLGELAHTALYENDRMFHEVAYRWEQETQLRLHLDAVNLGREPFDNAR